MYLLIIRSKYDREINDVIGVFSNFVSVLDACAEIEPILDSEFVTTIKHVKKDSVFIEDLKYYLKDK